MLNRGLRTSCATPATIEPISAMVSLWRSCSLRRTVSVTSWKFSTARSAPSPSAASARALTTQVRRVSGSLTSRAAGAPPVRSDVTSSPRAAQGSSGPSCESGASMRSLHLARPECSTAVRLARTIRPSASTTTTPRGRPSKVSRHSNAARRRSASSRRRSVTSVPVPRT